jgi:hypothetical protein
MIILSNPAKISIYVYVNGGYHIKYSNYDLWDAFKVKPVPVSNALPHPLTLRPL